MDKIAEVHLLEEQVFKKVKRAILTLELKPGRPIVEVVLARELGVSKTPVRGALGRLKRDGLVTYIPFKGYYVAGIFKEDIREIFEMRSLLEGWAARVAAERMSDKDIAQCRLLMEQADEAARMTDFDLYFQRGRLFHAFLLDHVGNSRMTASLENLRDHLERFYRMIEMVPGRRGRSQTEHGQIFAAIAARKPDDAERIMRNHILGDLDDFLEQIELEQKVIVP